LQYHDDDDDNIIIIIIIIIIIMIFLKHYKVITIVMKLVRKGQVKQERFEPRFKD